MRHAEVMRHGRRARPDPLVPVNEPRWLVVRDQMSLPVACDQLEPLTDLRAALEQERERRLRKDWTVEDIGLAGAFFFCSRDAERCCVTIESYAPGPAPMQ